MMIDAAIMRRSYSLEEHAQTLDAFAQVLRCLSVPSPYTEVERVQDAGTVHADMLTWSRYVAVERPAEVA